MPHSGTGAAFRTPPIDLIPPMAPIRTFSLAALHETGDLVAGALGAQRARELRRTGAAMSMDVAVSYALANIDPKLLTGAIAVG